MDLPNHHVSPARSAAARPVETFTRLFGSLLLFVYHCFDRVVINGYLSGLSRPGQVVHFFQKVVGEPVIGKEVLSRRTNYQKSVESFASNHGIGLEWAEPKVRKEDYVRPALRRMERAGRHGVYFILKSMEQGQTFRSAVPRFATGDPNYRILARQRSRFTHSYFYIRDVMDLMFECAARWELFNDRRNPIQIVRIKDSTKRRPRPTVLTVTEYDAILALLKEPYRTMVIVAQCLGLRVSEIAALQWDDFDFEKNLLLVQRSFVSGHVDDVKTEYSRDYVPLHESLVEILLAWSKDALTTKVGWVFASALTNKPYHPTEIQNRHIRPAACCLVECPKCGAGVGVWCRQDQLTPNGKRLQVHEERRTLAGQYASIGWHTFRHTYRSWLDETGAPMKVRQELMRHAPIQTTMNVYGQAMASSKREANGKVVGMVLKPVR